MAWNDTTRACRALLVAFPAAKLLVHLLVGDGYGYHRDELYYLACARHLDWGYVDHPPLSILLLRFVTEMLGEGVRVIRLVPAVAGALTVLAIGLLAGRLGGGPSALALAMGTALAAPVYLALDGYYSMNALDLLLWAVSAHLFLTAMREGRTLDWAKLGLVLGLGLQNKISVSWLIFGLGAGLLLTPERQKLRTVGPWLAAGLALLVLMPHLLFQASHGWPTAEFMRNAALFKMVRTPFGEFAAGQVRAMLPVSAPLWIAGLLFFLFQSGGRGLRALGIAFLAIFGLLALSGTSRDYYLAPAYTWLLAGGGVSLERGFGRWARVFVPLFLAIVLVAGAAVSPVVLALLPHSEAVAYARRLRAVRAQERSGVGVLPETLAHMNGWPEIVDAVAEAYRQLPAAERAGVTILAPNYGVAGALDRFGPSRGLPWASSGHNNYFLWGPRGGGDPWLVVGHAEEDLERWFADVETVGTTRCAYCMPYEDGSPIRIARRPVIPTADLWIKLKRFE